MRLAPVALMQPVAQMLLCPLQARQNLWALHRQGPHGVTRPATMPFRVVAQLAGEGL
ncbi:hypothetical protein D3C78_1971380 [compost metagenome]